MGIGTIIAIVILVIIAAFLIGMYNTLVRLKNAVKNALSQIDVQLTRRYELIPNLVETAKKYMAHEKETLEAVIQARNMAYNSQQKLNSNPDNTQAVKDLSQNEGVLGQQMGRFMMLMESYPELKANATMGQMMEELTSTENKVAFSRQAYNDSVMTYNTSRETFPTVIIANFFGFHVFEHLKIEDEKAKQPVKVNFN